MIAQPTKCPQLVDSSNQQKIGKIGLLHDRQNAPN